MGILKRANRPRNSPHISRPVDCCAAAGTGHDALCFKLTVKKCTCRSARAQMFRITLRKKIAHVSSNSTLTVAVKKFAPGEFATPLVSPFDQAQTSFG